MFISIKKLTWIIDLNISNSLFQREKLCFKTDKRSRRSLNEKGIQIYTKIILSYKILERFRSTEGISLLFTYANHLSIKVLLNK